MAGGTWKFPLLSRTTHPRFFSAQVRKNCSWDSCFATKSFKIGMLAISRNLLGPPHSAVRLFGRPARLVVVNGGDKD
jgi:hypothetical protein